eukprot:RCo027748
MVLDATSALAPFLEQLLQRPLSDEETTLLEALSPEGVAKVNVDMGRGVDISKTLEQLRTAHRHLKQRRATLEAQLCSKGRSVVGLLSRPPTTDELALLVETPVEEVLKKLQDRFAAGESLEDVMEELAQEHKYQALGRDARFCSTVMRRKVSLHALAPTECMPGVFIPGQSNVSSVNCLRVTRSRTFVCLSAGAVWFHELPQLRRTASAALPSIPWESAGTAQTPHPPHVPKPSQNRPCRSASLPQLQVSFPQPPLTPPRRLPAASSIPPLPSIHPSSTR